MGHLDDNWTFVIIYGMIVVLLLVLFLGTSDAWWVLPLGVGIVIGIIIAKIWNRHKENKQK